MLLKRWSGTLVLLFISSICIQAQTTENKGRITGIVTDTVSNQNMVAASVIVMNLIDSTVIASGLTQKDGSFAISNLPMGELLLSISFQGYENMEKNFTIKDGSLLVNLGKINMEFQSNELEGVTVRTPPVQIKKDTVEFNAGMFTTKPNGNVEDLLKKLPGVEVDKDGNIKAQGEAVQRVFVDGKRFFGDDPKMATQNLPPDIIDKIQVFDGLSDQSNFTGFDDGNRTKTINIITKKDKRKGYFGKGTAAIGNKDLYQGGASISKFNGNQQLSFVGQVNNTNRQFFSSQDILGSSGGGGRGGQGMPSGFGTSNNGLTTTLAGGLNYKDVWSKNTEAYGSYFYSNVRLNTDQKSLTENLSQNDSSRFNNNQRTGENRNENHRFNFNIETKFDSNNTLIIRPNISYQNSHNTSQSVTTVTRGKLEGLTNSTASSNRQNDGYNANIDATYRHRFQKRGRTISLNINAGNSDRNGEGNNYSIVNSISLNKIDTINQQFFTKNIGNNISSTISYTEPIGKNQQLEFNFNNSYSINTSDRQTFKYDSSSHNFKMVDTALTNAFENTYNSNRVSVNYRIQNEKFNFSIGSGVQFGNLASINNTKNTVIKQSYTNLFPTLSFNYRFSRTQNLRFFYNGRTSQPNVNQLQPIRDETDPLNVRMGNPGLKQEFNNSFRMLFSSFDNITFKNIFASVNASFTNNNIVNAVTQLPNGGQEIQPVNLSGNYNLSAYFNYAFPLKKPKSNLNFSTNLSHSRNAGLVNNLKNFNRNYVIGETIRWTTNLKEGFDMNFSASPTYNIARYSVQPRQNANYFSQILSAEPTFYTKSGWIISSDFHYTAYSGRTDGYNTAIPLWSASLAKQLFKNKAGELKFTVYDLLNQNVNTTRTVTENYIQDMQTKVLTRYALLSFTYNLRKFGGQQMPAGPGGPRMREGGGGGGGRNWQGRN